jgi:hypothetical protein
MGSCLDPGLPGTGLQIRMGEGGGGWSRAMPPYWRGERSVEGGEMEETWWGAKRNLFKVWCERISGQESEKIVNLFTITLCNEWCLNPYILLCDHLFSFRRINHLVLHHLHWSSINTQAEYHVSNICRIKTNTSDMTNIKYIIDYVRPNRHQWHHWQYQYHTTSQTSW